MQFRLISLFTVVLLVAILIAIAVNVWPRNPIDFAHRTESTSGKIASYPTGSRLAVVDVGTPSGPRWRMGSANPPLSAIEAIQIGVEKRKTLIADPPGTHWTLKSCALVPWDAQNGYWYWELTFDYKDACQHSYPLRLVVFMDGRAADTSLAEYPPR